MKTKKIIILFVVPVFLSFAVLVFSSSLWAKPVVEKANYVGSETCLQCHEEVGKAFQKTIHGRLADFETKGSISGCESCHGPGSAHVEDQDPTKIISFKELTPSEAGEICLKCHRSGAQMDWQGSAHEVNGVSCTSCHDPHVISMHQLKKKDPDLCYSCHANKRAQMNYPSHHPIKEKKMNCSSCHDSHGGERGNLKAETLNELCLSCHAEKQGPFTFEHMPVVENCSICHDAHGTIADHLQRQTQPFLCMQCHMSHEDFYLVKSWQLSGYFCTQCHSQIHGSDSPSLSSGGAIIR